MGLTQRDMMGILSNKFYKTKLFFKIIKLLSSFSLCSQNSGLYGERIKAGSQNPCDFSSNKSHVTEATFISSRFWSESLR